MEPSYNSDDQYDDMLAENHQAIEEFQTLLYANQSQGMLIIFQGMDTAGKDGAIKHVMSGVNPQGCSVVSFKSPSTNELSHDFLWRNNIAVPSRGFIGIFNRSYYEEVLITRVHPELIQAEKIRAQVVPTEKFWKHRYDDIKHHEKYLHHEGYETLKIFIHISKDEQKRRLLSRFEDPKKLWKISKGDITERGFWSQYQTAYEECIRHTSTKNCPWYIVPGDDKKNARFIISQILKIRFEQMGLSYPKLKPDEIKKLKKLKTILKKR